jgi:UDP-glucose 4-epimerase
MANPETILLTGGAGFIGSHILVSLLEAGYRAVVVDNLCNAKALVLDRVQQITGQAVPFHRVDVRDRAGLDGVFRQHPIDAVIHLAGLKAVGESTEQPLRYHENNVAGAITLLQAMDAAGCRNLVFSSSATVYGAPERVPITETMPLAPTNPYGRSKVMVEDICRDLAAADPRWHLALLRYFNPVGAHPSGLIGEDPQGIPNNLMPYLLQVAIGRRPYLQVHGSDYPTPDGTGVRDYIHVMDLAEGHLAALRALPTLPGATPINLGTGQGYSVLNMLEAMAEAVGQPIPHQLGPRRPGDIAACYAEASLARQRLGWQTRRTLEDMCRDAWAWQTTNPEGYPEA